MIVYCSDVAHNTSMLRFCEIDEKWRRSLGRRIYYRNGTKMEHWAQRVSRRGKRVNTEVTWVSTRHCLRTPE